MFCYFFPIDLVARNCFYQKTHSFSFTKMKSTSSVRKAFVVSMYLSMGHGDR
jgi:hypothetical protein